MTQATGGGDPQEPLTQDSHGSPVLPSEACEVKEGSNPNSSPPISFILPCALGKVTNVPLPGAMELVPVDHASGVIRVT